MTSREPSWADALDTILTSRLRSVHTSLPGTITAYDAAAVTATVELAVELEVTTGAYERVPPLADVPVVTPGAWSAGDKCLVIFAEEDWSKWFTSNSVEPPALLVRHGLHALAVPFGANAGDAVDFIALKTPTESGLLDLLDGIISAAGSITAPGGGPAFVSALNVFKTSYQLALQVGSVKMKAR